MPENLFPEVERVIYGKSPLVEVICQVRFPADLRIETTPPADFQQRVRDRFPLLAQRRAMLIPAPLAKALEPMLPPTAGSTTWEFKAEDGSHTLELQRDKLTLVSRKYQRWEAFSELFQQAFSTLRDVYSPPFFTRVGLRYRDVIQRSKLELGDEPWSSLLQPHVLAELAMQGLESRAEEASRNLLLKLPYQEAKVRLQHGFAQLEDSPELAYLIDCDFFVERTEAGNVDGALEYFHANAARFFRWCITDRLHRAMDPRPVD